MTVLLTVIHVGVCLFLILVVLLQTGKGADLAGAFGGGGSQTAFGARGATTLLHKVTTGSAVAFMATSLILAILASSPSSVDIYNKRLRLGAMPLVTSGGSPVFFLNSEARSRWQSLRALRAKPLNTKF